MSFQKLQEKLEALQKNKHFKYGVPFFGLVIFGAYMLRQSQSIRYEFRKVKPLDREELQSMGLKVKNKAVTLEEVFENVKKMDIDNWENIRGPRLFDETPPTYD